MFNVTRRTFNPIENKIEILRKLEEVAEELEGDMAAKGWAGRTVTLKFKRSTYEGEELSDLTLDCAIRYRICVVCIRAKATNHLVTKKDELFNVRPIRLLCPLHES